MVPKPVCPLYHGFFIAQLMFGMIMSHLIYMHFLSVLPSLPGPRDVLTLDLKKSFGAGIGASTPLLCAVFGGVLPKHTTVWLMVPPLKSSIFSGVALWP